MADSGSGSTVKTTRVDPAKPIKSSGVSPKAGFVKEEPAGTGSLFDIINRTGDGLAAAASTGTGGNSPLGTTGTGGTQTAFGDAFLPTMYGEAWSNPDTLVRELFRQKGIGTQGGSYASALDVASGDKLKLLWMMQQAANGGVLGGTPNFIDWGGQYMNQQLTPGGHSVSMADIAHDLQNARGDANNPLRNYLANSGLTPSDQAGNLLSTLNTSMQGANLPDIVRAAYMARAREIADTYQNNRMRGVNPGTSFLDSSGMSGFINSLAGGQ